MRVLHLMTGNDVGGAKTHIMTLLSRLKESVEVELVCLTAGEFYNEAKALRIPVRLIEQKSRFDLSIVPTLKRMICSEKVDIVHSHGARPNFICSFLRKSVKVPFVTTLHSDYRHDFDHDPLKKYFFTPLSYYGLRRMDYYFTVTEAFKHMLLSRKFALSKMRVIYNGIDTQPLKPKLSRQAFEKKYHLPSTEGITVIGMAARLHPVKGLDLLLRAVAHLAIKRQDFLLVIAGSSDKKQWAYYQQMVTKLKIKHRVVFLGHVEEMTDFYQYIDIHVLPSYSEGFPYVLLEAGVQAVGTVASNAGGIPEMISHGQEGLLFQVGQTGELIKNLRLMLDFPEIRSHLGESLYHKIKVEFSAEQMAARHIELYNEICEKWRKR